MRYWSLLKRKSNTHKGDYGHVFVLAGSVGLTGAAYLTSQAALLSGSGLVTLGIPESLNPIMAKKLVEVMTKPLPGTKRQSLSRKAYLEIKKFSEKIDVLAIGPGLSKDRETQALVRRVVKSIDKPMVIDADGLNALVGHLRILLTTNDQRLTTVLTPHPGEMARLIEKTRDYVQANRKKIAREFAKKYNVILVLKGHRTVVASPEGKVYINKTGNPGMATAGSGDVLTGMIAAFLGQGLSAFTASKYAVCLHGLAGDLAAKEKTQLGMVASDIIEKIPEAIKRCS